MGRRRLKREEKQTEKYPNKPIKNPNETEQSKKKKKKKNEKPKIKQKGYNLNCESKETKKIA